MTALTEEAFRALLDDHGLLKPGALATPDRDHTFTVFAQRPDATLDSGALKHQGNQFFDTRIGLTVDKYYDGIGPAVDAARIVVSGGDGTASGTRLCFGRAADDDDLRHAESAERSIGTYGLALLAKRCRTVWLVVPETEDDRAALTIAAILASTMLGPIVCPGGREIIGVRSARLKLEGRASPYR